jgi:hypothetical protein
MSSMPSFNFAPTGFENQEELREAAGFSKKKTSRVFDKGIYDLQIISAANTGEDRFDSSWMQTEIVLSDGSRRMKKWLKVPTVSIRYNEGPNNSYPLRQFMELQAFLACFGEQLDPTADSLSNLIPKYFGDPSVLIGKILTVELGYYRNYVMYVDGKYQLVDKKDEPISDELFETRMEAEAEAKANGINIQRFPEILKFIASEQSVTTNSWE